MKLTAVLVTAFVLITLGGIASTNVKADSWKLPSKKKYCSANKRYCVEVSPKKLESQLKYFQDKVDDRPNAGALEGLKDNHPTGTVYARRKLAGYSRKTTFQLLNEVSPVSAVVSNNGEYFVTFDNWHSVGYGDDVVVIYRTDGTVIKKFGLEDLFTEGDIETFSRSTSSRNWGDDHYIDDAKSILVLRAVSNGRSYYDADAKFYELKIELVTGRPLEPKQDLFRQRKFVGSTSVGIAPNPPSAAPGKPKCAGSEASFESPAAVHISAEQFYAKATDKPLPSFPPIARQANAEGSVIVELLVAKTGEVRCVRALAGHPLFQAAAMSAALKWKFEPFETSGDAANIIGVISMDFKITEVDMNPNHRAQ